MVDTHHTLQDRIVDPMAASRSFIWWGVRRSGRPAPGDVRRAGAAADGGAAAGVDPYALMLTGERTTHWPPAPRLAARPSPTATMIAYAAEPVGQRDARWARWDVLASAAANTELARAVRR